jgi:multiple sugar transport system substrate-binding protein
LNHVADDFFLRTAKSIETAYVRPRYRGYVGLQERAGNLVAEHCKTRGNVRMTLEQIDVLYRASLTGGAHHA